MVGNPSRNLILGLFDNHPGNGEAPSALDNKQQEWSMIASDLGSESSFLSMVWSSFHTYVMNAATGMMRGSASGS